MSNQVSHQLTPNVKLLHKVVIESNKQILVLKRSPQSLSRPNCWDLPGGNSEWPTKSAQSGFDYHLHDIVRELVEETSISLKPQLFTHDRLVYFRSYFDAQKQIYTLICGWKLELKKRPTVTLSSEHSRYEWISYDQIDAIDFGGQKGTFIQEIVRNAHG